MAETHGAGFDIRGVPEQKDHVSIPVYLQAEGEACAFGVSYSRATVDCLLFMAVAGNPCIRVPFRCCSVLEPEFPAFVELSL